MAGRKTMKGRFILKNPSKYVGNSKAIFFRSGWESRVMRWLDTNNSIIYWSSETLAIPYQNPIALDAYGRPKTSRYFPDFLVKYRDRTGNVKTEIIEVKPERETKLVPGMSERDKLTYAVNQAKWAAARQYANANGATFRLLTEKSLFR